jgi:hypothetical protein
MAAADEAPLPPPPWSDEPPPPPPPPPLPEGWAEVLDPSTSTPYYYHQTTQATVWDRPADTPEASAAVATPSPDGSPHEPASSRRGSSGVAAWAPPTEAGAFDPIVGDRVAFRQGHHAGHPAASSSSAEDGPQAEGRVVGRDGERVKVATDGGEQVRHDESDNKREKHKAVAKWCRR